MSVGKRLQERLRRGARRELREYGIRNPASLRLLQNGSQASVVAQKLLPELLPRTEIIIKTAQAAPILKAERTQVDKAMRGRGTPHPGSRDTAEGQTSREEDGGGRGAETLIPISRDELNARFLATFLSGTDEGDLFTGHFFLCTASQADLELYAKIEGLERRELQLSPEEREADAFAARIQQAQGQTQASLAKSYWHLRKMLGKSDEGHLKGAARKP